MPFEDTWNFTEDNLPATANTAGLLPTFLTEETNSVQG